MPPEHAPVPEDAAVGGPAKPMEPAEQRSRVRGAVADGLRPSDGEAKNYDVEQNMREIRAILAMNAEILERCESHRKQADSWKFNRCSFDLVEAYTINTETHFVTYPERTEKSFDMTPLYVLPDDLKKIFFFQFHADDDHGMIHFNSFFERSLILHDDVLGPFLAVLKDHLMSVQVCLGEIEAWIMEPQRNVKYIEHTFGAQLVIPEEGEELINECHCSEGTHPDSLECLRCWCTFESHGSCNRVGTLRYECPSSSSYFRCRKTHLLKKYTNAHGSVAAKFDMGKGFDQRKLEKLMEFMSMEE